MLWTWHFHILLKVLARQLSSSMMGFGATASLFPGGALKNATHTSPGNTVEFNQSGDDFETPEVFPSLCAICIIRLANGPWAWCVVTGTFFLTVFGLLALGWMPRRVFSLLLSVSLGVQLDSVSMQARLVPAQVCGVRTCFASFKLGHHYMSQAPGSHDSAFSCTVPRAVSYEAVSVVDEAQRSSLLVAGPPPTERVTQLILQPLDIAGSSLPVAGGQDGRGLPSPSDYNRCLLDWLGRGLWG